MATFAKNMGMKMTKSEFGATYNTQPGEDFGKITQVFPVDADWDGYRYHGYCIPTKEEIECFFKGVM